MKISGTSPGSTKTKTMNETRTPATPPATSRPPVIVTGALTEKKRGSRKNPATKPARTRKPKVQEILDIEHEAKAKKDQYRMAQRSGGILVRILKLVLRMTEADKTKLSDDLSKTITPKLV